MEHTWDLEAEELLLAVVAGLVVAEGLVGRESLVTQRAPVRRGGGGARRHRLDGARGSAVATDAAGGEHDETEREVLLLGGGGGGRVGGLGTVALGPRLHHHQVPAVGGKACVAGVGELRASMVAMYANVLLLFIV